MKRLFIFCLSLTMGLGSFVSCMPGNPPILSGTTSQGSGSVLAGSMILPYRIPDNKPALIADMSSLRTQLRQRGVLQEQMIVLQDSNDSDGHSGKADKDKGHDD